MPWARVASEYIYFTLLVVRCRLQRWNAFIFYFIFFFNILSYSFCFISIAVAKMSWGTFEELGNEIIAQCKILDAFIKTQELAFQPSFSNYKPWQAFINRLNEEGSEDEKDARTKLLDKTADLRDLVLGPAGTVVWPALTVSLQLYFPSH